MKNKLLLPLLLLTFLSSCASSLIASSSADESSEETTSTDISSDDPSSDTSSESSISSSEIPSSSSSSSSISSSSSEATSLADTGDGFYEPTSYPFTKEDYDYYAENFTLGTLGVQKMLVVPVMFSDYTCGTVDQCDIMRTKIEKAFFGTTADTGWESVASFYSKSSYGRLDLQGTVTPFYAANMTAETFGAMTRDIEYYDQYFDPTWQMTDDVIAWYKTLTGTNLSEYDQNQDGFIDAIYMIYMNPNKTNAVYSASAADAFWAYTYWNYGQYFHADVADPKPMTYAWSSQDFMNEGYGFETIDAHTYIHEMGHVIGLDDYYTYTANDWGATGGVDMMDYNIVDHNAYSKFYLGWADPIVIDGTKGLTEITLGSLQDDNRFILINNNWNGTAFDEYLMLEFYTPTGLNYLDSQVGGYPGNMMQGFTVPGIKLFHVDSRMGKYSMNDGSFLGFTDVVDNGPDYYPYIAASNSSGRSQVATYKLLHLLEGSGAFTFKSGGTADNNTLFKQGQSFDPVTFARFFPSAITQGDGSKLGRFNDGSKLGYTIYVSEVTATSATIQIHRL